MHDGAAAADALTRVRSIAKYRRRAARYDASCGPTWTIRERCIAALDLAPGERVLDVGCGTGLSLPLLRDRVGEQGAVFGCDQSPEMLAQARARVAAAGWRNVMLIETAAQSLALPATSSAPLDALLFHYTHDILRSPAAVARLLSRARPGARVAIAGIKYFPWYLAPLNPWVYWKNHGYNGAPGGLARPWSIIAARLTDWRMQPTQFGMGYIGCGIVAGAPRVAAAATANATQAKP